MDSNPWGWGFKGVVLPTAGAKKLNIRGGGSMVKKEVAITQSMTRCHILQYIVKNT